MTKEGIKKVKRCDLNILEKSLNFQKWFSIPEIQNLLHEIPNYYKTYKIKQWNSNPVKEQKI